MVKYQTPEELVDLLAAVEDQALDRHFDSVSEETLIECKVCGLWEDHTDLCPVPAIKKWFDALPDAPQEKK